MAMRVGLPIGHPVDASVMFPKISLAWSFVSIGRYIASFFGTLDVQMAPEIPDPTAPPISRKVKKSAVAAATSE